MTERYGIYGLWWSLDAGLCAYREKRPLLYIMLFGTGGYTLVFRRVERGWYT